MLPQHNARHQPLPDAAAFLFRVLNVRKLLLSDIKNTDEIHKITQCNLCNTQHIISTLPSHPKHANDCPALYWAIIFLQLLTYTYFTYIL